MRFPLFTKSIYIFYIQLDKFLFNYIKDYLIKLSFKHLLFSYEYEFHTYAFQD